MSSSFPPVRNSARRCPTATKENASRALAPQDFGLWVLGNFATVDEVKRAVEDIVMVPTPMAGLGSDKGEPADAHFFSQDKSGKSIVIEPIDGKLKVSEAPLSSARWKRTMPMPMTPCSLPSTS